VLLHTSQGDITIELYPDKAPKSVERIKTLTRQYNRARQAQITKEIAERAVQKCSRENDGEPLQHRP